MRWTGCTWKPAEQFTGAIFFLSASQIQKEYLKCIHAKRTPLTYVVNSYYSGVAVVFFFFLRPVILNEIRNSLTFFAVVCIFLK